MRSLSLLLLALFAHGVHAAPGGAPGAAGSGSAGGAPGAAGSARPAPVMLGETRPLETRLGDTAIPTALEIWVEMIAGASRSVDLEHFYLSHRPGEALQPVLDAIGRAAARGVRVRLLLDGGMYRTYPGTPDSLGRLANVTLRTVDWRRTAGGGVQHAKFMIVDGREAWIGSQNLDWRAFSHIHELGARVRIASVASAVADVFETDWAAADTSARATPVDRARLRRPAAFAQDGVRGEVTLSASPRGRTPASLPWDRDVLVAALAGARREIVAQVLQYGVGGRGETDSTLHFALVSAARRGVKVRLIVSDWVLGGSGESALKALTGEPNIEVRISRVAEWSGGYIPFARVEHCKYMVADSECLWLGTSNWEPGYFSTSRNLAFTFQHAPLARQVRAIFQTSWDAPSALEFGATTSLAPREHRETPPPGAKVYGE